MQIAGSTCRICAREIIFANEGASCAKCGIAVHLACCERFVCPACDGLLDRYEPPKTNTMPERDLRFASLVDSSRSGPAAAILFAVLAFVAGLAALFWEIIRPQGF